MWHDFRKVENRFAKLNWAPNYPPPFVPDEKRPSSFPSNHRLTFCSDFAEGQLEKIQDALNASMPGRHPGAEEVSGVEVPRDSE
jgi:hypothetical protein